MSDDKKPDQVFVVQREVLVTGAGKLPDDANLTTWYWVDIATVTLPAHTPRRLAIKEALKDVQIAEGEKLPRLRALDAKSAEVFEPEAVQPPMEWKL